MSHAHVVVAKNKKIWGGGDKMELGTLFGSIFLGTLMTGAASFAFVAFVVYVVSKL